MKRFIVLLLLPSYICSFAQSDQVSKYGLRHFQILYKGDNVDILIKSKPGEEQKKKPLLLFCQGSLPIPLIIKYNNKGEEGIFNVFVFNPDSLSRDFHLAIIGKPYIPLIAYQDSLASDLTYMDKTGKFPAKYIERNLLDYYVERDIEVIKFLQKQPWITKNKLVVAGHSEGSTIAAKLTLVFPGVSHLIYSGGNPLGRILSIIEQQRALEKDSIEFAKNTFDEWKKIVADPTNMNVSTGDTYKATYDFSIPPIEYLQKLKIPVLVCYGTKDFSAPFNDYFRVEMIKKKKLNFTFKDYLGTEHNYFPLKQNGEIDYDVFNWDKVASDWLQWLHAK